VFILTCVIARGTAPLASGTNTYGLIVMVTVAMLLHSFSGVVASQAL
jgi:hypothetical protein